MRKNDWILLIPAILSLLLLSGCGKKNGQAGVHYEVIDGKIVQVREDDVVHAGYPELQGAPGEAAADVGVELSDGLSYLSDEEYNSLAAGDSQMALLQARLHTACDVCREIYRQADKGSSYNVTLSGTTISSMLTAIGNAGYPAQDSQGKYNMQC